MPWSLETVSHGPISEKTWRRNSVRADTNGCTNNPTMPLSEIYLTFPVLSSSYYRPMVALAVTFIILLWFLYFFNVLVCSSTIFSGIQEKARMSCMVGKTLNMQWSLQLSFRIPYHFLHLLCKCMGRSLNVPIENL